MWIIFRKFAWITLFVIGMCQLLVAQDESYHLVLQGIHLQAGERIEGVDISIKAGAFAGVSGLPAGWTITVDNDPSWQTNLKGDAKVGAATVDASSIQKLNIVIHKFEFGDLKFQVSGTLLVTMDFESLRKIPLSRENFIEEVSKK